MEPSFFRSPSTGLQQTPTRVDSILHNSSMKYNTPGHGQSTSAYLPGYLLGGHTPSQMDTSYGQSTRNRSPGKMKSWSPSRPSGHNYSALMKTSTSKERRDGSHLRNTLSEGHTPKSLLRGKAPPVADLFTESTSPTQNRSQLKRDTRNTDVHMMTLASTNSPNSSVRQSVPDFREHLLSPSSRYVSSPAQIDPFYSQGESITSEEVLDECCITVFGFPPSASSYIMQQFSQYGSIIKHDVATNGNWMNVKYHSKLQAKKALSKNGKIFGSNMMIGVKQCIDKDFMFDPGKENWPSSAPIGQSFSSNTPVPSPSRKTPIRPLTAAYQAASNDHEVAGTASNTPQKNSNLVSKAMEYVFGW